jgi:putative acetyltransferase
MTVITPAASAADLRAARHLFEEYAAELGVDLAFQNFTHELDTLPGAYAPPRGALLLARTGDTIAGCVALRPMEGGVCEMKRLFVRPAGRRHNLGRALVAEVIAQAEVAGYRTMVLDTLDWMLPAIALYESFGFERTAPYYDNPLPGAVYFRLRLAPHPHSQ